MALEIDSNSAEGEESPAVNEAEAVRRMLGKKVPEIVDPAAVLDDKSSTVEERGKHSRKSLTGSWWSVVDQRREI